MNAQELYFRRKEVLFVRFSLVTFLVLYKILDLIPCDCNGALRCPLCPVEIIYTIILKQDVYSIIHLSSTLSNNR